MLPPHSKAPAARHEPGIATKPGHGPVCDNKLDLAEVRAPGAGSVGSAGSVGRGRAARLLALGSPRTTQLCPTAAGTLCPLTRVAAAARSRALSQGTMVSTQTLCQEEVMETLSQHFLEEEVFYLS